jgi:hypothetical protein
MKYQPRPEPIAHGLKKCKGSKMEATSKKIEGVKRRKGASWSGNKMPKRELLLAKLLKPSKKSTAARTEARSSGLSVEEKASATKTASGLSLVT